MTVPAKLGAFAVALGLSFLGGAALGGVVGPIDVGDPPPTTHQDPRPASTSTPPHQGEHGR